MLIICYNILLAPYIFNKTDTYASQSGQGVWRSSGSKIKAKLNFDSQKCILVK